MELSFQLLMSYLFILSGFEPGKPPSKMEVMKLLMDKEFRDAAQEVSCLDTRETV